MFCVDLGTGFSDFAFAFAFACFKRRNLNRFAVGRHFNLRFTIAIRRCWRIVRGDASDAVPKKA